MDTSVHNSLVNFIWKIADECLRDVYVKGRYRDVILPMVVLRRIDMLLEETKEAVDAEVKFQIEEMELTELDPDPLKDASGYVFYNTSKWTLKKLHETAGNNNKLLLENFEDYLNGFSENVKEIITRFSLKGMIRHMSAKGVLMSTLERFVSPKINMTPQVRTDDEGNTLPALTNMGMGYVFEELIRKFNEENNEEAGEHFTPREVIELMTKLVFEPIKDQLPLTLSIYDPACGSGGMLTESERFIQRDYQAGEEATQRDIHLFGKEINDETYAICKSDMMIKGHNPENIRAGSTLSTNEFSDQRFDFMLSNPPYGKSWSTEQKYIIEGGKVMDERFVVSLTDYWGNGEEVGATPRSSDGQLLFLMEMVDKMKSPTTAPLGSRVISVHNGSSLFTGDAGSGESNIRRYLIENDLLDAIIQLPQNFFYNTGITTYIWLLSNNKPAHRKGKVQLIDASLTFRKLRKNLGMKNCEFSPEQIQAIVDCYLNFQEVEREVRTEGLACKLFDLADFGYQKVTIERPERLKVGFSAERIAPLRFDSKLSEVMAHFYGLYGEKVYEATGYGEGAKASFLTSIKDEVKAWCKERELKLKVKAEAKLLDVKHWQSCLAIFKGAELLLAELGEAEYPDFNEIKKRVKSILKAHGSSLTTSEQNAILSAVSWYDESAERVVKKVEKFKPDQLEALLSRCRCTLDDLPEFGYYPTGKSGEFITYETSSALRDSESIPLKRAILDYFKAEVQPHVSEAWINIESVKIGYEISFNRYFYVYEPPRPLEEIEQEIRSLEDDLRGLLEDVFQ